jgi:hypothetical protein
LKRQKASSSMQHHLIKCKHMKRLKTIDRKIQRRGQLSWLNCIRMMMILIVK